MFVYCVELLRLHVSCTGSLDKKTRRFCSDKTVAVAVIILGECSDKTALSGRGKKQEGFYRSFLVSSSVKGDTIQQRIFRRND